MEGELERGERERDFVCGLVINARLRFCFAKELIQRERGRGGLLLHFLLFCTHNS